MGPSSALLGSHDTAASICGSSKRFFTGKSLSSRTLQRLPFAASKRIELTSSASASWSGHWNLIKFETSGLVRSSVRLQSGVVRVQQGSSLRKYEIQGVHRRGGFKRSSSLRSQRFSGEGRNANFQTRTRISSPGNLLALFSARKKIRPCAFEGGPGEPSPLLDWSAFASIEQAIQFQAKEESRLFWFGPPTGDLAEIESFCRLHRLAERLHLVVMNALRSYSTAASSDIGAGPGRGDVSLVEENVAAGLAHVMSIVHEHKMEILCSTSVGRPQVESPLDEPPPFAKFRAEVRECCKQLETAIESLLPADSEQRLAVRQSMLKLKNACLDAGFHRPEGLPKHADIPNLAVVRLRPSKSARTLHNDDDVAFWRGGQVTEEGLEWLLQKGFKVIVDLRGESAQPIAQSATDNAVASGKLRVVRLPVGRGQQPTAEQVEEFARLVGDDQNKPVYLQTLAGVGRASEMVSKWREYVLREKAKERREKKVQATAAVLHIPDMKKEAETIGLVMEDVANETKGKAQIAAINGQVGAEGSVGASVYTESSVGGPTGTGGTTVNGKLGYDLGDDQAQQMPPFDAKNAFEAQRPPDVFSRPAMARFMKQKKGPSEFLNGGFKPKTQVLPNKSREYLDMFGNIAGPAGRWGLATPGIPRAEKKVSLQETNKASQTSMLGSNVAGNKGVEGVGERNGHASADPIYEQSEDQEDEGAEIEHPSSELNGHNGALFLVPTEDVIPDDGDEAVVVEGDMCASTTGVVRLQSRKKAEMFLVRTDGYSCTRERVKESTLAFTHPSTQQQMLMWKTPPRTCLILKKLGDELLPAFQQVASFLHHQEGMNVVVEPEVHDRLARSPGFGFVTTFYSQDTSELHERVDFIVCLGGDGVILHASNLFRSAVPPVVSFNLGSLGFLTAHPFKEFKDDLRAIIHGHSEMMTGVYITLRMRLRCELFRNGKAIPGKVFDVLNEVVVDRGSNPYLSKIECYERNRLITKVQADGVIIATPTGSTAYSTAAGGSMVHPNVPCMLFTPICPHSLSFRPVILPDSALLELKVPRDARNNAWVSFDGKKRQQLSKGDSVCIRMSEHPLPTVNKSDQTDDWFQSLVRCLNWNERLEQRPLNSSA